MGCLAAKADPSSEQQMSNNPPEKLFEDEVKEDPVEHAKSAMDVNNEGGQVSAPVKETKVIK
jgi:hypothetical protein